MNVRTRFDILLFFSLFFFFFMFRMAPKDVAGILALVRREGLL